MSPRAARISDDALRALHREHATAQAIADAAGLSLRRTHERLRLLGLTVARRSAGSVVVSFRCAPEQAAALRQRAADRGQTVGAMVLERCGGEDSFPGSLITPNEMRRRLDAEDEARKAKRERAK
jgi:6-phosphofructokinase